MSGAAIARLLRKPDGKSLWSEQAIQDAIRRLESEPKWRGERTKGSGRPRETTKAQDKAIVKEVFRSRGRRKVTVSFLRKKFPWTKDLGNTALEERLGDAGLKWMRRRKKMIVTKAYLEARIAHCHRTKRKHQATLNSWGYSDGTTFYLDRDEEDNEQSQRAALGSWMWRRADHKDAMFQECLGPSSYKKAQGIPVRVWGVLSQGVLSIEVLEAGEVMNQDIYAELIEDKFEGWLRGSSYLVQDFERCLRSPGPLLALSQLGVELVEGYPKCSQDFNAIENCWQLLRDRIHETMPSGLECRDAFVERLKVAVQWLNRTKKEHLWYLGTNQKERCDDCLSSTPPGGRTKW